MSWTCAALSRLLVPTFVGLASVFCGPSVSAQQASTECLEVAASLGEVRSKQSFLKSFPSTQEALDSRFLYAADEVQALRTPERLARARRTLFVIPQNDGEAVRIQQMLEVLEAPHVLRAEPTSHSGLGLQDMPEKLPDGITDVVLVENPAPDLEAALRARGVRVRIVDHHDWGDLKRRQPLSSLEQVAEYLDWPMNRMDRALAINDRSFIPGLRRAGFSEDEIRAVRRFDLQAQGQYGAKLDSDQRAARELIPQLEKVGPHVYFDSTSEYLPNPSLLAQEVALNPATAGMGLVEMGSDRIKISSSAEVIARMTQMPWRDWGYAENAWRITVGGDELGSMYMYVGVREKPAGATKKLPEEVRAKVLALLREASIRTGR